MNIISFFVTVIFRTILQQPQQHLRVQKRGRVCHQQEKPYCLQSLSSEEMSDGRNVQVGFEVRSPFELVQDPLFAARAASPAATAEPSSPTATESPQQTDTSKHNPSKAATAQQGRFPDAGPRRVQKLDLTIHQLARISEQRQLDRGVRETRSLQPPPWIQASAPPFRHTRPSNARERHDGASSGLSLRKHAHDASGVPTSLNVHDFSLSLRLLPSQS